MCWRGSIAAPPYPKLNKTVNMMAKLKIRFLKHFEQFDEELLVFEKDQEVPMVDSSAMHYVSRGAAEIVEDSKPVEDTKQESWLDKKLSSKKRGKKNKKAKK